MDFEEYLYAIRISANNFGFDNNIKAVPLYAVFLTSTLCEYGESK